MEKASVTLMIVDDNEDDLFLLEEAQEALGNFEISAKLQSGEEVLPFLRRSLVTEAPIPDLILLDINMPRKNGLDVLRELKTDAMLNPLPVVVFSSSDRQQDIDMAYERGASSFVRKPIGFTALKELLERLVAYWRYVAGISDPKDLQRFLDTRSKAR